MPAPLPCAGRGHVIGSGTHARACDTNVAEHITVQAGPLGVVLASGSCGESGSGQGTLSWLRNAGRSRPGAAERFSCHRPGPAHPRDGRVWVITELLGHSFGAAPAAERSDGRGDGLPDLPGADFLGTLQSRHEQGVGTSGTDAEVVHRWPHRGTSSRTDTSTTQPEYDTSPLMQPYCPQMRVDYNKLVRDRIPRSSTR